MIDVIKYEDDCLPISVIIPLSEKRKKFFNKFVFPMVEANFPAEIIINDNEGTAPKKRNDGFLKSTQPFVYFLDDDIVLPADHLKLLYDELQKYKNDLNYGFAYSGYYGIVLHSHNHPISKNFKIDTIEFDYNRLKKGNYISTMALVKRDIFPMFDETLKRLQDYDVWLTIASKGIKGKAVFDNEYFAYYLDEGITSNSNNEQDALVKIIQKHKLGI